MFFAAEKSSGQCWTSERNDASFGDRIMQRHYNPVFVPDSGISCYKSMLLALYRMCFSPSDPSVLLYGSSLKHWISSHVFHRVKNNAIHHWVVVSIKVS